MKKGALLPLSCRLPILAPLRNIKSGKKNPIGMTGFFFDIFIV